MRSLYIYTILTTDLLLHKRGSWGTLPPPAAIAAALATRMVAEAVPVALVVELQALAARIGSIYRYHRYRRPSVAVAAWV